MHLIKPQKVVAIHDLSGVGHVSLAVVIPILSTMGIQVVSLPTSILSNNTQFDNYSFLDLTDEMPKIIDNWKILGVEFDTFYSGFLGSPKQIDIVKRLVKEFKREHDLVVVDPVLGDNGKLYKCFDSEFVSEMRSLINIADIITPNLTEVSYLLGTPYEYKNSDERLKYYLSSLSDLGPEVVVITNIPVLDDPHRTSVYAYSRDRDLYWKVTCPYIPTHYPGVGDTFSSVMTGALMQGDSLPMALDRATQFCYQGIRATFGYDYDTREGILLEKVLPQLNIPIQVSSYELI